MSWMMPMPYQMGFAPLLILSGFIFGLGSRHLRLVYLRRRFK